MMESTLRKMQDKLQKNLSHLSTLKRIGGGGARFFGNSKRGEAAELQADLNSNDKEKQKNAVKRIIANMTLGRDVSQLFTDVVKLGQTTNLELKKLVYLYVLNTAKMQPGKALMAVNTFLQDDHHASPIVRALALRTMLCVRVECVTEYTLEPLRRALHDQDPYVRKTAAIGVGKLFHQNPRLFEEQGFLDELVDLLADQMPVVASNAAAILAEIRTFSTTPIPLQPPKVNSNRLLTAMNECTEWGQLYILELLSGYSPSGGEEASNVAERVAPRLSSGNPGVVLAAIKVMTAMFSKHPEVDTQPYVTRINNAVLSLTKGDHETQYVVLCNIKVLLELYPGLLASNVESFFIRFNDPVYLKTEKLRLIMRLLSSTSSSRIIAELQEYSAEVDPTFAREVIAAIATACIKCDNVTQKCVSLLLLVAERRPELLPSIITATKNIVRKYPDLIVDLIVPLIKEHSAEMVEVEEAKVSFVWMLGEFCDVIEGGDELVRGYIDTFCEQETSVQLAIVTGVVKIFLRNPAQMESTLNHVLELATQHCTDPDLRDRAWMYWRLLAKGIGVEKMKRIIHGRKPPVEVEKKLGDTMTTGEMTQALNTVSATYGKPHRAFLPSYGISAVTDMDDESDYEDDGEEEATSTPSAPTPTAAAPAAAAPQAAAPAVAPAAGHVDPFGDLFTPKPAAAPVAAPAPAPAPAKPVFDPFADPTPAPAAPAPAPVPSRSSNSLDDMFGGGPSAPAPAPAAPSLPQVLDASQGNGLAVNAAFMVSEEPYNCSMVFHNRGSTPISGFQMQFNKNAFGFVPAVGIADVWPSSSLQPGQSHTIQIPLRVRETHFDGNRLQVQVAVKSTAGMGTFFVSIERTHFLLVAPPLEKSDFVTRWKGLDPSFEFKSEVSPKVVAAVTANSHGFSSTLGRYRFQVVVHNDGAQHYAYYGCFKTHLGVTCLFELLISKQYGASTFSLKNQRAGELQEFVRALLEMAAGN